MRTSFRDFFQQATCSESEPQGRIPYPYQERFAQAEVLRHLVRAPTGAGKTATAVLGWLWRRTQRPEHTPRRLVYCLPMRVLVEQSEREARGWIENLGLAHQVSITVLMGGVEAAEWYLHPERPAILIGTQDMLLSRALNRGYAASRFHWPVDFGLLNNDCLWVFDEPQLMASGVSTSAQLAGLRAALGTCGPCPSVWMSATLEPGWLDTIDFRGKFPGAPLELDENDYDPALGLHRRMTAEKTLAELGISASKDMKESARAIMQCHVAGTQTLVVLNTVERAKAVYTEMEKLRKNSATPKLLLVHSRFRPQERQSLNQQLQERGAEATDRIIVATQVVEAGVDISSRTLVTELAPWASLVQRMGRCNRTGGDGPGQVFWIDLEEKLSLPYSPTALDFARRHLRALEGQSVSPRALDDYKRGHETPGEPFLPFEHKHVLRRRDLLDLFDTSPDLSGNDIDIQRFVRGDDPETDVQMFWRDLPDGGPSPEEPSPRRRELCNVPINQARDFLQGLSEKKQGAGYVWDHLEGDWAKVDAKQLRPGLTVLLPASAGGYSRLGWDRDSTTAVTPVPAEVTPPEEAMDSDLNAAIPVALTIAEHTQHVCDELAELLGGLGQLPDEWRQPLEHAARWHDAGKALLVAQKAMHDRDAPDPSRLLAKSGRRGKLEYRKYGRIHFRHELGSALAVLQQQPEWPFVIAYLIASHHGRVRLAIRALPGEEPPADPSIRFALGIQDGDPLPEVDLGEGMKCPEMELNLSPMQLGGEGSWTARALKLLAELGPFRLAYWEALLRAADVRASRKEANDA
jgi:CRISPR-associated endonuclease/helicase Cas3